MKFDFRLQNIRDYRPWLLSLAVVTLFVAINYVVVGGPVFETSDDPGYALLVAGIGMVDKPDYHIFFSHFLIGQMLVFLHGISPRMPWYSIYILTSQVIAMTVIVRLLASKFTRVSTAVLVGAMFLFVGCSRWVNYLQFTNAGALMGLASTLLMIAAFERPRQRQTFVVCLVLSFLLLIFSTLIRPWSGYLSCITTGIALLAMFVPRKKWRRLATASVLLLVGLACSFAVHKSNELAYSSPDWVDWRQMNNLWSPLRDFSSSTSKLTGATCEQVGWSATDLSLFKSWYVLDEDKFSVEKLAQLSKNPADYGLSMKSMPETSYALALLAVVIVVALATGKSKLTPGGRAIVIVSVLAMAVTLWVAAKLPARVYGPMLTFIYMVLLWNTCPSSLRAGIVINRRSRAVALASFGVILYLSANMMIGYRQDADRHRVICNDFKADLIALNPNKNDCYVRWLFGMPIKYWAPFDLFSDELCNLKSLNISSAGRNPHVKSRMEQFGIKDVISQLDKEHVYLLSNGSINMVMDNYVVQHYNKKPLFEKVFGKHDNFVAWKVKYIDIKDFPGTDRSPLCPAPGASDYFIDDDPTAKVEMKNLNVEKGSNNLRVLTPRDSLNYIEYTPARPMALANFSHFFIEVGTSEWAFDRCLKIQFKHEGKGVPAQVCLLPDSKIHRYTVPLSEAQKQSRLTNMRIVPNFAMYEKRSFEMGRFGFLQEGDRLATSRLAAPDADR